MTGAGFDGASDETDDRVFWVVAANQAVVESAVTGLGANVVPLGQSLDPDDLDFFLPEQAHHLQNALKAFAVS